MATHKERQERLRKLDKKLKKRTARAKEIERQLTEALNAVKHARKG